MWVFYHFGNVGKFVLIRDAYHYKWKKLTCGNASFRHGKGFLGFKLPGLEPSFAAHTEGGPLKKLLPLYWVTMFCEFLFQWISHLEDTKAWQTNVEGSHLLPGTSSREPCVAAFNCCFCWKQRIMCIFLPIISSKNKTLVRWQVFFLFEKMFVFRLEFGKYLF